MADFTEKALGGANEILHSPEVEDTSSELQKTNVDVPDVQDATSPTPIALDAVGNPDTVTGSVDDMVTGYEVGEDVDTSTKYNYDEDVKPDSHYFDRFKEEPEGKYTFKEEILAMLSDNTGMRDITGTTKENQVMFINPENFDANGTPIAKEELEATKQDMLMKLDMMGIVADDKLGESLYPLKTEKQLQVWLMQNLMAKNNRDKVEEYFQENGTVLGMFTQFATGMLDAQNLIPLGGAMKATTLMSRVGSGIAYGALGGAMDYTLNTKFYDNDKTLLNSLVFGAGLGGAIGAGVHGLSKLGVTKPSLEAEDAHTALKDSVDDPMPSEVLETATEASDTTKDPATIKPSRGQEATHEIHIVNEDGMAIQAVDYLDDDAMTRSKKFADDNGMTIKIVPKPDAKTTIPKVVVKAEKVKAKAKATVTRTEKQIAKAGEKKKTARKKANDTTKAYNKAKTPEDRQMLAEIMYEHNQDAKKADLAYDQAKKTHQTAKEVLALSSKEVDTAKLDAGWEAFKDYSAKERSKMNTEARKAFDEDIKRSIKESGYKGKELPKALIEYERIAQHVRDIMVANPHMATKGAKVLADLRKSLLANGELKDTHGGLADIYMQRQEAILKQHDTNLSDGERLMNAERIDDLSKLLDGVEIESVSSLSKAEVHLFKKAREAGLTEIDGDNISFAGFEVADTLMKFFTLGTHKLWNSHTTNLMRKGTNGIVKGAMLKLVNPTTRAIDKAGNAIGGKVTVRVIKDKIQGFMGKLNRRYVEEYNLAKKNGYKGTHTDFVNEAHEGYFNKSQAQEHKAMSEYIAQHDAIELKVKDLVKTLTKEFKAREDLYVTIDGKKTKVDETILESLLDYQLAVERLDDERAIDLAEIESTPEYLSSTLPERTKYLKEVNTDHDLKLEKWKAEQEDPLLKSLDLDKVKIDTANKTTIKEFVDDVKRQSKTMEAELKREALSDAYKNNPIEDLTPMEQSIKEYGDKTGSAGHVSGMKAFEDIHENKLYNPIVIDFGKIKKLSTDKISSIVYEGLVGSPTAIGKTNVEIKAIADNIANYWSEKANKKAYNVAGLPSINVGRGMLVSRNFFPDYTKMGELLNTDHSINFTAHNRQMAGEIAFHTSFGKSMQEWLGEIEDSIGIEAMKDPKTTEEFNALANIARDVHGSLQLRQMANDTTTKAMRIAGSYTQTTLMGTSSLAQLAEMGGVVGANFDIRRPLASLQPVFEAVGESYRYTFKGEASEMSKALMDMGFLDELHSNEMMMHMDNADIGIQGDGALSWVDQKSRWLTDKFMLVNQMRPLTGATILVEVKHTFKEIKEVPFTKLGTERKRQLERVGVDEATYNQLQEAMKGVDLKKDFYALTENPQVGGIIQALLANDINDKVITASTVHTTDFLKNPPQWAKPMLWLKSFIFSAHNMFAPRMVDNPMRTTQMVAGTASIYLLMSYLRGEAEVATGEKYENDRNVFSDDPEIRNLAIQRAIGMSSITGATMEVLASADNLQSFLLDNDKMLGGTGYKAKGMDILDIFTATGVLKNIGNAVTTMYDGNDAEVADALQKITPFAGLIGVKQFIEYTKMMEGYQ